LCGIGTNATQQVEQGVIVVHGRQVMNPGIRGVHCFLVTRRLLVARLLLRARPLVCGPPFLVPSGAELLVVASAAFHHQTTSSAPSIPRSLDNARCCATRTAPGIDPTVSAVSSADNPTSTRNTTISRCLSGNPSSIRDLRLVRSQIGGESGRASVA